MDSSHQLCNPQHRCTGYARGFIIHIYEGTAHQPGTFGSMIDGTVTEKWAWTHHPAWYRAVTGRDPREAYEREKTRGTDRNEAFEESGRAQRSELKTKEIPPNN